MLDNIFASIANMSITASIAAVIIMGIRMVLRQKLPKLFSYALWSIVLIRLLIPYSFSSPLSLFNIIPVLDSTATAQMSGDMRTIKYLPQFDQSEQSASKESVEDGNVQTPEIMADAQEDHNIIYQAMPGLSVIWMTGFILFFGFCIITYFRTIRKLNTAVKYHDSSLISGLIDKLEVKQVIGVYTSDMINSPVVCGVVKPRLILPVSIIESSNETVLEHIMVHELVHVKRFDYITNAISVLALCMHWFNPIVWISFMLSHKDMEMSCDERVLSILGHGIRNSYASTLLSLAVKQNNLLNGGTLAFGESSIKSRIKGIMRYKKPAFRAGLISVVVLVILCIVMISNPYANTLKDEGIDFSSLAKDKHIDNWANYEDIPEHLINSVIAIEDEKFRVHNGIDWAKSSNVFIRMIISAGRSPINGGSTITQQLVKNITGDNERTLLRKKRELERAFALEKKYSKDQILEAYLNIIYFGHDAFGIVAASSYYFSKDIKELSLAQSAALAAVIAYPNQYNPVDNLENNKLRRDAVIEKMFNFKMITEEEKQKALSEDIKVNINKDFIMGEKHE